MGRPVASRRRSVVDRLWRLRSAGHHRGRAPVACPRTVTCRPPPSSVRRPGRRSLVERSRYRTRSGRACPLRFGALLSRASSALSALARRGLTAMNGPCPRRLRPARLPLASAAASLSSSPEGPRAAGSRARGRAAGRAGGEAEVRRALQGRLQAAGSRGACKLRDPGAAWRPALSGAPPLACLCVPRSPAGGRTARLSSMRISRACRASKRRVPGRSHPPLPNSRALIEGWWADMERMPPCGAGPVRLPSPAPRAGSGPRGLGTV